MGRGKVFITFVDFGLPNNMTTQVFVLSFFAFLFSLWNAQLQAVSLHQVCVIQGAKVPVAMAFFRAAAQLAGG